MSIRRWGDPGMWTTNFSHIYRSTDYGQTWQPTHIFRPNSGGFANFQMGAFLKHGRYVYEFCTPNGRMGDGYLARVPARSFEELHAWEYWNGKKWIKDDPAAAAPVIPGRISELTVQWNPRLKRFMMLTLGNGDNIYLRYSKDLINWTNRYLLIPTQRAKILQPLLPAQSERPDRLLHPLLVAALPGVHREGDTADRPPHGETGLHLRTGRQPGGNREVPLPQRIPA
ncbi:MAG: DUF4185 domain-containing protein [Lawsonella clevelandensis]